MKLYDTLIVGAGPAGLSAAIYLARFMRSVLVIDKKQGRSTFPQITENYLGFPKGIAALELRKLGRRQAMKFGAHFATDDVINASQAEDKTFIIEGKKTQYQGKTLLIATGVTDVFPKFKDYKNYVGKSLFWCITCDGYKTRGKRVMIIGNSDEAVGTCMQFLTYTPHLLFVTNCPPEEVQISSTMRERLEQFTIPYFEQKLEKVHGKNGYMKKVMLDNGKKLEVDLMFNQQGAFPNVQLAQQLELRLNDQGYIKIELEQRTSLPGVYAAGDVTRYFSHQVITAAHEGSMAAQAINYDLYESYKKI